MQFFTRDELLNHPKQSKFVFDIEVYPNLFFMGLKCLTTKKYYYFEISEFQQLDRDLLGTFLCSQIQIGFNSIKYDRLIQAMALAGKKNAEIKEANDWIIAQDGFIFDNAFENRYKLKMQYSNNIDLIEIAPGIHSLKLYAARQDAPRLQDLPFKPSTLLTPEQMDVVRRYCIKDLDDTERLYYELEPHVKLREDMTEMYKVDLRSKSDAQISETIIGSELAKQTGFYPKKPNFNINDKFEYNTPDNIVFQTTYLKNILSMIQGLEFGVISNGNIDIPKELLNLTVTIGGKNYKFGSGGLHSQEKSVHHKVGNGTKLYDRDVASFYPRMIINQKLFPPHLGEAFLVTYESIVNRRIAAKGVDAILAAVLKIAANGGFGKFGSRYSILFAAQLLIQVTISGQLYLLMLIEMLEINGISVISANTDGFIVKIQDNDYDKYDTLCKQWEVFTGLDLEETEYSEIFSRDVNSYGAVKVNSEKPNSKFLDHKLGVKTKGDLSERGSILDSILSKSPQFKILNDALLMFVIKGVPIEETIFNCKDMFRFVCVSNVKGGAKFNNCELGRVVRFYYSKNGSKDGIRYVESGNLVPKSEGSLPLMETDGNVEKDIDYKRYIELTKEKLYDYGIVKRPGVYQKGLFF